MAKRRATEVEEAQVVEVVDEVEAVEEPGSVEQGLVFATTISLVAAIVVGLMELGKHYGTGPFAG